MLSLKLPRHPRLDSNPEGSSGEDKPPQDSSSPSCTYYSDICDEPATESLLLSPGDPTVDEAPSIIEEDFESEETPGDDFASDAVFEASAAAANPDGKRGWVNSSKPPKLSGESCRR